MYNQRYPIYSDVDLSDYQPRYEIPERNYTAVPSQNIIRQNHSNIRPITHLTTHFNPGPFEIQQTSPRQRKTNRASALIPNNHYVVLEGFSPENIKISMDKRGKVCVRANKEAVIDMGENGQRKHVESVEQTLQLPDYLVNLGMLTNVQTRFEEDKLVFVYPKKPSFTRVEIEFDDSSDNTE